MHVRVLLIPFDSVACETQNNMSDHASVPNTLRKVEKNACKRLLPWKESCTAIGWVVHDPPFSITH